MKDIDLGDLLPGKDIQDNLVNRWAVLVSRVVVKFVEKFKHFRDVVVHPREHSSTIWVSSCIFNEDILINFETRTCSIYEQSIFLFITSR